MKIDDVTSGTWYATHRCGPRPRLVVTRRTAIFTEALHRKHEGEGNPQLIAFTPDVRLGDMGGRRFGRVGYLTVFPHSGDFTGWVKELDTPPELAAIAGQLDELLQQIPVGRDNAVPIDSIRAWAKERGFGIGIVHSRYIEQPWTQHAAAVQTKRASDQAIAERRRAWADERNQAWKEIERLCGVLDIKVPSRGVPLDRVTMEPAELVGILRLAAGDNAEPGQPGSGENLG